MHRAIPLQPVIVRSVSHDRLEKVRDSEFSLSPLHIYKNAENWLG